MSNVKHCQAKAQHLEAAAHLPRGPYQGHQTIHTLVVSQQAQLPHGQKLYALSHQAHAVQHLGLPPIDTPET